MEAHITWQMIDEDGVLFTAYLPLAQLDIYDDMMSKLKGKGWKPVRAASSEQRELDTVEAAPQKVSPNGHRDPRLDMKEIDGKHWCLDLAFLNKVMEIIKEEVDWNAPEVLIQNCLDRLTLWDDTAQALIDRCVKLKKGAPVSPVPGPKGKVAPVSKFWSQVHTGGIFAGAANRAVGDACKKHGDCEPHKLPEEEWKELLIRVPDMETNQENYKAKDAYWKCGEKLHEEGRIEDALPQKLVDDFREGNGPVVLKAEWEALAETLKGKATEPVRVASSEQGELDKEVEED